VTSRLVRDVEVLGPWSLATSRAFWEGFTPAALGAQEGAALTTAFCVEGDGERVEVTVTQTGDGARVLVTGDGDLDAAVAQTCRMLALDVDGRGWAAVADADPVLREAREQLPGLRPCGFHSPYEAAAWSVLSQRIRMAQAARLSEQLVARLGTGGAFPAPQVLAGAVLDLPGRKAEYLTAVAEAALEGRLDGGRLRAMDPAAALASIRAVKGLGPFAAELVLLRGANAPDVVPTHEKRLEDEVRERYRLTQGTSHLTQGTSHRTQGTSSLEQVSDAWRPYRTWAAVHLRVLRERRLVPGRGHDMNRVGSR